MSKEQNGETGKRPEAEFAEAMKELQRGERTAQALEDHLDSLEKKIEELLAQAEKADAELGTQAKSTNGTKKADSKGDS